MESNKTQVILYFYDVLINGKAIEKEPLKLKFRLSEATFIRYIAEIRSFLVEHHPELELHFKKSDNRYEIQTVTIRF